MSVSANTLFHFTKFDAIKSILFSKGFWPSYSEEHLETVIKDSPYSVAYVPVVCFCDLKLIQLLNTVDSKHTEHFGNCGIGLSKKWGIDNRVSPIVYVHENSVAARAITHVMETIRVMKNSKQRSRITNAVIEQIKFLKPYEGFWQKAIDIRQISQDSNPDPIRYYDEREWRFAPKERHFEALNKNNFDEYKIRKRNIALRKFPLTFHYSDIKFIVLENDDQKQELSNEIRSEDNRLSLQDQNDLITKILTIKELREDY